MSNDDWYGVLWMGIEQNKTYALIYSFSMMILLNYCTFGLVIAVILDGFSLYLDEVDDNSAGGEEKGQHKK